MSRYDNRIKLLGKTDYRTRLYAEDVHSEYKDYGYAKVFKEPFRILNTYNHLIDFYNNGEAYNPAKIGGGLHEVTVDSTLIKIVVGLLEINPGLLEFGAKKLTEHILKNYFNDEDRWEYSVMKHRFDAIHEDFKNDKYNGYLEAHYADQIVNKHVIYSRVNELNREEKSFTTRRLTKDMKNSFVKEDIANAIQFLLHRDQLTKITKAKVAEVAGIIPQRINDYLTMQHIMLIKKINKDRPFHDFSTSVAFDKFIYGEEIFEDMSVKGVCESLNISMKTYYKFKKLRETISV